MDEFVTVLEYYCNTRTWNFTYADINEIRCMSMYMIAVDHYEVKYKYYLRSIYHASKDIGGNVFQYYVYVRGSNAPSRGVVPKKYHDWNDFIVNLKSSLNNDGSTILSIVKFNSAGDPVYFDVNDDIVSDLGITISAPSDVVLEEFFCTHV